MPSMSPAIDMHAEVARRHRTAISRKKVCMRPALSGTQHFASEMTTDLEVGVRLFSATLSMGTSALASGK